MEWSLAGLPLKALGDRSWKVMATLRFLNVPWFNFLCAVTWVRGFPGLSLPLPSGSGAPSRSSTAATAFAVFHSCGVGVGLSSRTQSPGSAWPLPVPAVKSCRVEGPAGDRTVSGLLGVQQAPTRPHCLQLRCRDAGRDCRLSAWSAQPYRAQAGRSSELAPGQAWGQHQCWGSQVLCFVQPGTQASPGAKS